jgi:hypothetical protein
MAPGAVRRGVPGAATTAWPGGFGRVRGGTLRDQVDGEDPSTADLLHAIIDSPEKYAWMASAENRSVRGRSSGVVGRRSLAVWAVGRIGLGAVSPAGLPVPGVDSTRLNTVRSAERLSQGTPDFWPGEFRPRPVAHRFTLENGEDAHAPGRPTGSPGRVVITS